MEPATIEKDVSSLCPECLKVIHAHIFEEDEKVFIEKQCPSHGRFKDIYWSDASLYKKFFRYLYDVHDKYKSDAAPSVDGCPLDCGLCSNHQTGTLLANIDVTCECNLSCPVCFADSGGLAHEPTLDQIKTMMLKLRAQRPVPCPAVQLSGGEPTLRKDLPDIVALAKEMGFSQVQLATNGLLLSENLELCKRLEGAGLNTIYLQFDGVNAAPYQSLRGRNLLSFKHRAIENFRAAAMKSIVLVPTLAKGINDSQMGDIIRFASRNLDVIRGINVQPISFSGRINSEDRASKRVTIPDFLHLVEDQTDGMITRDDFYPISIVAPISRLIAAETDKLQPIFTVHPCCGAATYVYCHHDKMIPISRFVDIEGLFERVGEVLESYNGTGVSKLKMRGRILRELPRFVDDTSAPAGINATKMLLSIFLSGSRQSLKDFHSKSLFLGAMHFQDAYNIDLDRLRRCGVHYAVPDGRIIPFCAYNSIHRRQMENHLI